MEIAKFHPHTSSNQDPITREPGAHPLGVGVGAAVGAGAGGAALGSGAATLMATGATFGAAAGPVGVVVGAVFGGIAGGLVGRRIAESLYLTDEGADDQELLICQSVYPEDDTEYRRASHDQGELGRQATSHSSTKADQARATLQAYEAWNNIIAPLETCEATVDVLNRLLRSEVKAVETYRRAIEMLGHESGMDHIAAEHREALEMLEQQIYDRGNAPGGYSGPWGAWVRAVGDREPCDRSALLRALWEGEESEIENYAEAMQNAHLDTECRTLIHDRLLPQTRQHMEALERIMDSQQ